MMGSDGQVIDRSSVPVIARHGGGYQNISPLAIGLSKVPTRKSSGWQNDSCAQYPCTGSFQGRSVRSHAIARLRAGVSVAETSESSTPVPPLICAAAS